jgi:hypothetical protein
MKHLKTTIISATLALCCFTQTNAQSTPIRGISVKGGHNPKPTFLFSVGGGLSLPSSDAKDIAFLSNSAAINADFYVPLVRKGWDGSIKGKGSVKMTAGLNFGGVYNFGGSGGFGTTPNPFLVTGQTSSTVSNRGGFPIQTGFRMGVGPQVNFHIGKFILSPMVLGEYLSMTQKEKSFVQTTEYNGQSYEFNLATLPETKTTGFAVTPKLRLHYMISDRFGLFADASYTTGPKIETTVSKLIPNGNPLIDIGSYNLQQLQTGTMVKGETKSTTYNAMGFNFGVVIGLGNRKEHGKAKISEFTNPTVTDINKDIINSDGEPIKKGWNGLEESKVINNGGTPTTDSTGNTVYVMTFSSGCKRACSEEWTQGGAGWICSGEQTNISCPIINYDPSANQSARMNLSNLAFNNDGTFGIKNKISKAELNKINGIKDSDVNVDNHDGLKTWTECSGGLQWDCHIDSSGSIISNYNGKSCTGNWSTY